MTAPQLQKLGKKIDIEENVCLFAQTNFRNQLRRFGIKTDDRRRHMYVIGKTGMGKTTMLENMVLHDIYSGHGVGIVDPHGDMAEKIIDYIPPNRINDVVYFNPADTNNPIGFNILEVKNEDQKHLVAAGLMAIFKKIWPDVWSSRMEYILNNTLLALLDYPGSTLLGINRLLADKKYRKKVVSQLKDPVIKAFWQNEFANYNDRYAQEAVAPIQNKIGQFLSASVIRNMIAQVKSTINIREIMDEKKILIMNLSKGRIGEDNSRLLGGMLISQIQLAAMERVEIPESERKDFFLFVDEFQNFANPSFVNILSEARKYRLSLILAHQYVKQLDELVADAVFGNIGTTVSFRVGGPDSEELVKEFTPTFIEEDLVNLPKFQIFLKLMIDGVASLPFSATTMPPIGSPTGSRDRVIRVSRERYSKKKEEIEEKIMRWSGMDTSAEETTASNENKKKVPNRSGSRDQKRDYKPSTTFSSNKGKSDLPSGAVKKKVVLDKPSANFSSNKDIGGRPNSVIKKKVVLDKQDKVHHKGIHKINDKAREGELRSKRVSPGGEGALGNKPPLRQVEQAKEHKKNEPTVHLEDILSIDKGENKKDAHVVDFSDKRKKQNNPSAHSTKAGQARDDDKKIQEIKPQSNNNVKNVVIKKDKVNGEARESALGYKVHPKGIHKINDEARQGELQSKRESSGGEDASGHKPANNKLKEDEIVSFD